jgi:hypothetical protein
VLDIETLAFVPYVEIGDGHQLASTIARHHILFDWSAEGGETPHFDRILDHQLFDGAVKELIFAFMGRMLFQVGQLDRWQVMPFFHGLAGTGKSIVLLVVQKMFRSGSVANLTGKREEVFGMDNILDKEVVLGRDMPAGLSKALAQELMQAMVSGEGMEIARKNKKAINVDEWTSPLMMASNHMPDYVNVGGNVGRRIAIFRFEHLVAEPDEGLVAVVCATEMSAIIWRALHAYHDVRARVAADGRGFWKNVPAKMLEWKGALALATNRLHEFLSMDDVDRGGLRIRRVDGAVTWREDFKRAFESVMVGAKYAPDAATFEAFGFSVEADVNVCVVCKQRAVATSCFCANRRRVKKSVVVNMSFEGGADADRAV